MKVVYYHRKDAYKFSIETYFRSVRAHLPPEITAIVAEASFYSKGLLKRVYIALEAAWRQGDINHVTGDIHFVTLMLKKRKTILTIHDLGFLSHPSPFARKILKLFWLTLPVKHATVITTVSLSTKNEILKNVHCQAAKIRVVNTCISANFKRCNKLFNEEEPVILQIGTAPNKNCCRMAEALEGIKCQLEIIGVPSVDYLNSLSKAKIRYRTFSNLSDAEIIEKYNNCDIVLFASTYEGFGMPIIEANTVGRVVITSNISSMPEVAANAACFVDPYSVDSIRKGVKKVIKEHEFRNELIEEGFRNSKRFNVVTVANQYADIYKQVLKAQVFSGR
ncbi:MAG: glycosyltransferase [Segetibacter sp.]|nr:glycosyltransferase [Segetibacter sp.]